MGRRDWFLSTGNGLFTLGVAALIISTALLAGIIQTPLVTASDAVLAGAFTVAIFMSVWAIIYASLILIFVIIYLFRHVYTKSTLEPPKPRKQKR